MATRLREDHGALLDLPLASVSVNYPADNTEYPVERNAPFSDHRQRGLITADLRLVFTTELGASTIRDNIAWLRSAADETTLTVNFSLDRYPLTSMSVGCWGDSRIDGADADDVSIPLVERITVDVSATERSVPREDYASGNAKTRDDGAQSGETTDNRSAVRVLTDSLGITGG